MSEWSVRRGIDERSLGSVQGSGWRLAVREASRYAGTAGLGPDAGSVSLSISPGGRGSDDPRDSAFAGKYRVIRKLGTGAIGTVYLAEHLEIGRLTAIKVLRQSLARSSSAREQFLRGAHNGARIHHSHVCAVYDVGETSDGLHYLAMEYVEGGSLGDVLARLPRFEIERACRIALQVLEALGAAHSLGIVHRDLKPGNIILAVGDDGDDHVKVLDFDLASRRVVDGEAPDSRLLIGSPEYMSPEQLAGEPIDGRSDLYSLGIILYRAVTGNFPFSAKGAQELMLKRLTEKPIPLREVSPSGRFPPGLQELLDAALARDPEDRFATAQEMSWALSQVADPRVLAWQSANRPRKVDEELVEAERLRRERSPFRRPVVRVFAFWAVGLVAGVVLGLIPNPFRRGDELPPLVVPPRTSQAQAASVLPDPDVSDGTLGPGGEDGTAVLDGAPDLENPPSDGTSTGSANPATGVPAGPVTPVVGADPPPDANGDQPASPPDTPAQSQTEVRAEIEQLMSSIPGSAREDLREIVDRAEDLYGTMTLRPATRAEAAYLASSAYAMLQDVDAMIRWSRNALQQNPSHAGALELLAAVDPG